MPSGFKWSHMKKIARDQDHAHELECNLEPYKLTHITNYHGEKNASYNELNGVDKGEALTHIKA